MIKRPLSYIGIMALLVSPLSLWAASFQFAENYAFDSRQRIEEDLYAIGYNTTISGGVGGDLLGAGFTTFVRSDILRDALVVGRQVDVTGSVGGNLRIIGASAAVSGSVGRDLAIAAGNVQLFKQATVDGSASIAGGTVIVEGVIQGDVKIIGGHVTFRDVVIQGDVSVTADTVVIGDNTEIKGALNYGAARQASFSNSANVQEGVFFREVALEAPHERFLPTVWSTWGIIVFIVLLAAGLISHAVLRSVSTLIAAQTATYFWGNLLRGLLVFVGTPILFILVAMTFIGIPFLLIGVAVYILLIVMGWIFTPIALGSHVYQKFYKKEHFVVSWKTIVLGVFLYVSLGYIPFLGFAMRTILLLVTTGSVFKVLYDKFTSVR